MIKQNPCYQYCRDVVCGSISAPKYVKLQCADFLHTADGKSKLYCINEEKLNRYERLLSLMIMPKGLQAGRPMSECLAGFQWLFIVAALCVVHRKDKERRRYQTALLEISRKNGKSMLVGIIFVLLMLTEPKFSKFYSVAPDGALSREVKSAVEEIVKSSPALNGKISGTRADKFRLLRDEVRCQLRDTFYYPLNFSTSRLDGKLPAAWVADEVGALTSQYPIEAMRSGQLTVKNKLGCIISTKYPKVQNPFEDEVHYAKRVLDGALQDDTYFSLLYEPDEQKEWMTDDEILRQANPLSATVPEIWEDLLLKRQQAIEAESRRENFLTKHCNITYSGMGTEGYVNIQDVIECRADSIDWAGRDVYVGVDLSMTNDNTAVAMVAWDEDNERILADVWAFIPEGRIDEKMKHEKIDYRKLCAGSHCIACGDSVIDYSVVEDFVMALPEKMGVYIAGLGFDRYNCLSSAQKWESNGIPCTEVKQHSSVLHPATKWLSECVESKAFRFTENPLLEVNFENCKCQYDTNLNRFVSKKKSSGKIDMVAALLNATFMLQQNVILDSALDWSIQII